MLMSRQDKGKSVGMVTSPSTSSLPKKRIARQKNLRMRSLLVRVREALRMNVLSTGLQSTFDRTVKPIGDALADAVDVTYAKLLDTIFSVGACGFLGRDARALQTGSQLSC